MVARRRGEVVHPQWLRQLHFDDLALTFHQYQHTLAACDAQLQTIDTDLAGYVDTGPFAEQEMTH